MLATSYIIIIIIIIISKKYDVLLDQYNNY